ncbi:MAG TPA: hypothetical protein ENK25_00670 [Bacteroidetes bacterium]|nr:hypothetical protein [Bacteroidota bacterium]
MMRKIAANYVFPVSSPPVRNGIVVVNDQGRIMDLIDPGGCFREMAMLVFYNGVLIPSFVFPDTGKDNNISENDLFEILAKLTPPGNREKNTQDDFDRLLKKFTLDKAEQLGLQNLSGSLEKGKKPGILLISPFDFERWQPAEGAVVKKIV